MGFWQLARLRGADFGVQERKDKSKQITLSATAHKGGAIGGSLLLLLTEGEGAPAQALFACGGPWSAGALIRTLPDDLGRWHDTLAL